MDSTTYDSSSPLKPLCDGWLRTIKHSLEFKKKEFQDDADECWKFFDGPYTWMYKRKGEKDRPSSFDFDPEGDEDIHAPTFQMTINKTAEFVQLFGPAMYQRNPNRKVNPRDLFRMSIERFGDPNDPMVQQQYLMMHQQDTLQKYRDKDIGRLFEMLLNYSPQELGLRQESRLIVDEALICGMSAWWTELVTMPSGLRVVGSFYDPVRRLVLDADADRYEECQYIARECIHPTWAVEREYGLPPGSLKGNAESAQRQMMTEGDFEANANRSRNQQSNDLLRYWKVWSKMGIGGRLRGVMDGQPEWKQVLEQVGDYCFLAIAPDVPYPLNVPPQMQAGDIEALMQSIQWPTPFWLDKGAWPFTPLVFHARPGKLWPMPHMKPALGEIKFVNWTYSFLAGKIRVACRDFLVMLKSLSDDVKQTIVHGPDYSVIYLDQISGDIDKVVKFIQHPTFNPEIYRVLEHMMELIDKRTGLSELLYGSSANQLRSAEEARVKQANASVRPDDMAQQVEDASSELSRRETAACVWHLKPPDVQPIVGTVGAQVWEQDVMALDPSAFFHQYSVTVEAGSTRRPNKDRDRDNLDKAQNQIGPLFFQYAQASGDVKPFNALTGDWAKATGLPDPERFMIQPPPMPAGPDGGQPPAKKAA